MLIYKFTLSQRLNRTQTREYIPTTVLFLGVPVVDCSAKLLPMSLKSTVYSHCAFQFGVTGSHVPDVRRQDTVGVIIYAPRVVAPHTVGDISSCRALDAVECVFTYTLTRHVVPAVSYMPTFTRSCLGTLRDVSKYQMEYRSAGKLRRHPYIQYIHIYLQT